MSGAQLALLVWMINPAFIVVMVVLEHFTL